MNRESPRPDEPDVQLSIFLHGIRFDFLACHTAAMSFVRDHLRRHHVDAAAVLPVTSAHRRLPNERLYLDLPPEPHVTRLHECEAVWFARDGVVRVVSVTDEHDRTVQLGGEHLGACFELMPTPLWTRVRRDHEDLHRQAG